MNKYKIFAGLGGGFGGANEVDIISAENEDDANEYAYEIACEIYESHAGQNGVMDFGEAMDEAYSEISEEDFMNDDDVLDEESYANAVEDCASDIYNQYRESWIDYHVELIEGEFEFGQIE